jgi:hypothetical protein
MITQIRELQKLGAEFAIELSSGRVIQIYDPWMVATEKNQQYVGAEDGTVAILHSGGAFELIASDQIVAVTKGVHWQEEDRIKARRARVRQIIEGKEEPK